MRARALAACVLAAAGLMLAACGFTPLYGQPGVNPGLSAIVVEAPDGRAAYLLRERLDDALARDRRSAPAYRLIFTLAETRIPRGLGPDNAASRYEHVLDVDWRLSAVGSGEVLTSGKTNVLVTYGAADAPYAGIAAQQDGQSRAAAEAAGRIRLELAQYFAARAR